MEEEVVLRDYLYSLRFYILFVSFLFMCAIVLGYIGLFNEVFSVSFEWIQELSENVKDLTGSYPLWISFTAFFIVIFLNNAFTCFLNIITGPLMGIFPLFSAMINGGLLGWVVHEEGLAVFGAIAPHGMFELPAYVLSVAIGLRVAREVLKRREERRLKMTVREGLWVYLALIVPLLIVAALIESALIVATLFLF
ncbi:MAG: stage II sporulation protein M [Methanophagales archaeon ANME-1-THS]|nr:MAG: stage II sporulation protein M [Methanophagales archaeon ANME-1-THS]